MDQEGRQFFWCADIGVSRWTIPRLALTKAFVALHGPSCDTLEEAATSMGSKVLGPATAATLIQSAVRRMFGQLD